MEKFLPGALGTGETGIPCGSSGFWNSTAGRLLFFAGRVYTGREVITVNKQQFGIFVAENRKAAGLTQKDLAERLHVTDKAVSKWERALSYPDVTLLEPLAEALGLGVEELMACRRTEEKKEEEPVMALLEISRENMEKERRRNVWRVAAAMLGMLAATLAVLWYTGAYVSEEIKGGIILKETVEGKNYIYVEQEGHLLRLKCGNNVDFDSITQKNERGEILHYRMDCRWDKRTYEGTLSSCQFYGISLGGMMDATFETENAPLFWYDEVYYTPENYYPDPYAEPRGQMFLCDYRFWTGKWNQETFTWEDKQQVLLIEDCISAAVADIDRDGHNEVVVRTRWPEKPYAVYDWVSNDFSDKQVSVLWLDSVSPELREQLMTVAEWQEEANRELREAHGGEEDTVIR